MNLNLLRLTTFICILSAIIGVSTLVLIQSAFVYKAKHSNVLTAVCQQIWAHRGLTTKAEENSLEAFQAAINQGARGIELDVFFNSEKDQFIVSHDPVTDSSSIESTSEDTTNSKRLVLETVFQSFGNQTYYWLDFKNLYQLSIKERQQALDKLEALSINHVHKSQIIVESIGVHTLQSFTQANFITSYWVTLTSDFDSLTYAIHAFKIKIKYLLGQFSAISTDIDNFSTQFQMHFPTIPTLLFTLNQESQILTLADKSNVKVILTDEPLYELQTGCVDDDNH